jgi:hypothetical protein
MRERTQGQVGVDHPGPGEQHESWVRSARRGASGPRPVRPAVPPGSARPEAGPRPAPAGLGGTSARASSAAAERGAAEAAARRRVESAAERGTGRAALERGAGRTAAERWAERIAAERGAGQAAVRGGVRPVVAGSDDSGVAVERGLRQETAGRPGVCGRAANSVAHIGRQTAARGPRLLVRRPLPTTAVPLGRVRRAVVGLAVVLAAAAVVFGLGRVADAAAHTRVSAAPVAAEVTITVDAPGTVWDVADGVAPGASGPERAAMVDRIVAANALASVTVRPGEVLRVPLR